MPATETWSDQPPGVDAAIAAAVSAAITDQVATAITTNEAATEAAELAAANLHDNGNSGASKTVDFANGTHQKLTLTASAPAVTLAGLSAGVYAEMTLLIAQDGTGSRLIPTFSPALNWGTPGAPVLSTAASKVDIVKLTSYDGIAVTAVLVAKGY